MCPGSLYPSPLHPNPLHPIPLHRSLYNPALYLPSQPLTSILLHPSPLHPSLYLPSPYTPSPYIQPFKIQPFTSHPFTSHPLAPIPGSAHVRPTAGAGTMPGGEEPGWGRGISPGGMRIRAGVLRARAACTAFSQMCGAASRVLAGAARRRRCRDASPGMAAPQRGWHRAPQGDGSVTGTFLLLSLAPETKHVWMSRKSRSQRVAAPPLHLPLFTRGPLAQATKVTFFQASTCYLNFWG